MRNIKALLSTSLISLVFITSGNAYAKDYSLDLDRVQSIYDTDSSTRKRIIEDNLRNLEIKEVLPQASIEIEDLDNNQISSDEKLKSFILSHNPKIQISLINNIIKNVKKYSKENNIDPKLVIALMAKESSFRTSVVSTSGAIGLGQLKRGTALEVGVKNPFNPIENIKGTARYLSKLSKLFNGDVNKTLASYYMGPGALKRSLEAGKKLPPQVNKYVNKIKGFHSDINNI